MTILLNFDDDPAELARRPWWRWTGSKPFTLTKLVTTPEQKLVLAVIAEAIRDLGSSDPAVAEEALRYLASPDTAYLAQQVLGLHQWPQMINKIFDAAAAYHEARRQAENSRTGERTST